MTASARGLSGRRALVFGGGDAALNWELGAGGTLTVRYMGQGTIPPLLLKQSLGTVCAIMMLLGVG